MKISKENKRRRE